MTGPRTIALAAAALALLAPPGLAEEMPLIPWQDAEAVARGEAIYAEHCASCHGERLEGEPDWRRPKPSGRMPAPPHDPSGHTWHHPDEQLYRITREGVAALVGGGYESDMPGFAEVLDEQAIRDVLAFIKASWPPRVIEMHDKINARQP